MGERAVPDLLLNDEPTLELTAEEKLALYKASPTGVGKILKVLARWKAYGGVARVVVQGYREHILELFSPEKKEVPKKSWFQLWK